MDADLAFTLFDKDGNGDVSRDEIEAACLYVHISSLLSMRLELYREIHRERLSIERSVADIDSAVGRLDNILVTLYVFVAILIIAVALVRLSGIMSSCSN